MIVDSKFWIDEIGLIDVGLLETSKLGGEERIVYEEGDFVVQPKTSHVQIDRSEHRNFSVGHDRLGVQQPSPIHVDLHSCVDQFIIIGTACIAGHERINFFGDDEFTLHSASGGASDRSEQ